MYSILKFIFNKIFVNKDFIKYQNPYFIGSEIKIVDKAIKSKNLIGPDNFIIKSEQLLEKQLSLGDKVSDLDEKHKEWSRKLSG